jgi:hypothetical protein
MPKTPTIQKAIILDEGKKAPFRGVLSPELEYRFEQEKMADLQFKVDNPEPEVAKSSYIIPAFITGALLGLVGSLVLEHR